MYSDVSISGRASPLVVSTTDRLVFHWCFAIFAVAMCRRPAVSFPVLFGQQQNLREKFVTGEHVMLACEKGYEQKGDPVIICIRGNWVRNHFECKGIWRHFR